MHADDAALHPDEAIAQAAGRSDGTGGAVHDLRATASAQIHVTVQGDGGRKRRREDVVVHRSKVLLPRDLVEVDGLRVTSVAWTVRDLAAHLPLGSVVRLLERCELLQVLDRTAFLDVVARGRRRKGTARLRDALELWTGEPVMTRSELEELVRARIAGTALGHPQINGSVCGDEVDFHWPALRVVLEVDGWETHRTRAAFERDRARDAKRQAAGWRTTRATYFQVRDAWDDVEAALLGSAAPMA